MADLSKDDIREIQESHQQFREQMQENRQDFIQARDDDDDDEDED